MRRRKIFLGLVLCSLLGLSLMHYLHGSFAHDSFAYLQTAKYFLGQADAFDVRRVSLYTFLLMPFVGSPEYLYLLHAAAAFAALWLVSRIVDAFGPQNLFYILLLIVPSYTTYILTSILQEAFAFFFLALSVHLMLRDHNHSSAAVLALGVLTKPAMLAFVPGFFLALLFHKHFSRDVRERTFSWRRISGKTGQIVRDGVTCGLAFIIVAAAGTALLLLLIADPLVAFKTLSARFIRDDLMKLTFPGLWFSLFGVLAAPILAYSLVRLHKIRKDALILFGLLFMPYLAGVWYQANIRYLVYLLIPFAVGVSQIQTDLWSPLLRASLVTVFILSCLYPFGPLVYYYDYSRFQRVLGVSAKPFIYYDSEYKGRQYAELCHLMKAVRLTPEEQRIHQAYVGTPILAYLKEHSCQD